MKTKNEQNLEQIIKDLKNCFESTDQDWFSGSSETEAIETYQKLDEKTRKKVVNTLEKIYAKPIDESGDYIFEPLAKFYDVLYLCKFEPDIEHLLSVLKHTKSKEKAFYLADLLGIKNRHLSKTNYTEKELKMILKKLSSFKDLNENEKEIIEALNDISQN